MATSIAELEAVITADTSGFDSGIAGADAKLKSLDGTAQSTSANFGGASAAMAAGAAGIGIGIADAVMAAGDFEAAMNVVGSVTGATATEMEALSAMALQVGQDTQYSAQQGADAISELGKAGIPIPDILNGAAMATANLAAAGEVDMARAAQVMSAAMNVFQIEGTEAADVADILAAGANSSASSVDDLANGLSNAGPAAAALGMDLDDTVAVLALLSDRGLSGAEAGTQLRGVLKSLTPATKPAREEFEKLGLAVGESGNAFFNAQGEFIGMEDASAVLYDSMKDLTDIQRAQSLETIFGTYNAGAAETMFQAQKAAVEGTGKGYAEYNAEVQAAGQATEVANAKMAGMNGALEQLGGSVETAKIAFGMAFLPVIEQVALKLTDLVNMFLTLPEPVQTVVSAVAAGAAAFLAIGSAIGFIIGPLGAFVGALAPVAVGIAAIAAPLALVVAGIAALYLAYTTNFLGFADGVNAALGGLTTAFNNFMLLVQNVAAAFGEGGLGAALAVVGEAFATLAANLPGMLQGASDAIMTWAQEQGTNILNGFNAIDWAAVGATIFAGIQSALSSLGDFAGFLLQKGADLVAGLVQGIADHLPDVATKLGEITLNVVGVLPNALTALLQKGADLVAGLVQGIGDHLPDVVTKLGEIATNVATILPDALTLLLQKGADLIAGIVQGIGDHLPDVVTKLGEIATNVAAVLPDAATALLAKGGEIIAGLLQGITEKWPEVDAWLANLATDVVETVGDFTTTLLSKGTDLLTGFFQGINDKWPEIDAWLANLATDAAETVGDLTQTLLARGTELLTGFSQGAQDFWTGTVQPWLASLPQLATDAVGDLASTLTPAGTALLDGLRSGAQDLWNNTLGPWLQSLPQLATDAIGDLSSTLVEKGSQLLDGLRSGAQDMWNNTLGPWIQSLPQLIVDALGDLSSTLKQKGIDLINGFLAGLQEAWTAVTTWASTLSIPWPEFSAPSIPGISLPGVSNPFDSGSGDTSGGGRTEAPPSKTGSNPRAAGGPVSAGLTYWVGEEGPELFTSAGSGRILSHGDSMAAMGGGGGNQFHFNNVTFVVPGVRDPDSLFEGIRQVVQSGNVAAGRGVA